MQREGFEFHNQCLTAVRGPLWCLTAIGALGSYITLPNMDSVFDNKESIIDNNKDVNSHQSTTHKCVVSFNFAWLWHWRVCKAVKRAKYLTPSRMHWLHQLHASYNVKRSVAKLDKPCT